MSVEVEYIESGTFVGGEEDCFVAGIESGDTCYVSREDLTAKNAELKAQIVALRAAVEPLVALADAQDALLIAMGCAIPAIHEGDDGSVADPDDRIIPFLRKRAQPHYITMRDACAARKVWNATNPNSDRP